MPLSFTVSTTCGAARAGVLATPHGEVRTPAFMPVGTLGAVKGVAPAQLRALGAEVMLANLYHLTLRPGVELIEELGGLHAFTGWSGPILTDSGGFQVFSLGHLRRLDEEGVTFRSHLDGAALRLGPEEVVDLQRRLGVDVAMVLDECPPWPVDRDAAAASLARTNRWAARSRQQWERRPGPGGLFAIVQGSAFRELRESAARELAALGFDGYAIGGVSVGEPDAERRAAVEWTAPLLPADRPRYLMGVGYPRDIVHAVAQGVDLFDCVLPARNARHGVLFTRAGALKLKGAGFRADSRPVEEGCRCPCCAQVSRAFLHHLLRWEPLTGQMLATLHNLWFYLDFMREVGESIASGTLTELVSRWSLDPGLESQPDSLSAEPPSEPAKVR
ncbi:MAG TPA: tRNA guanosine(34) transglycosylase Tgt [Thermoanaerobaculia bacterium]|jgi:queuine tRNA-ribosyltransferase|nr:tRNA guanosine(34) transglycosylase Tgt [Thermoanaerobaculia bacterium]